MRSDAYQNKLARASRFFLLQIGLGLGLGFRVRVKVRVKW